MEKEKEMHSDEKKYKKKKSVNWETKEGEVKKEPEPEAEQPEIKKEFIEIEVINKDGNTFKERVKYEKKNSKEFTKKREQIAHDEYKKAKEFLESHKNEEE